MLVSKETNAQTKRKEPLLYVFQVCIYVNSRGACFCVYVQIYIENCLLRVFISQSAYGNIFPFNILKMHVYKSLGMYACRDLYLHIWHHVCDTQIDFIQRNFLTRLKSLLLLRDSCFFKKVEMFETISCFFYVFVTIIIRLFKFVSQKANIHMHQYILQTKLIKINKFLSVCRLPL